MSHISGKQLTHHILYCGLIVCFTFCDSKYHPCTPFVVYTTQFSMEFKEPFPDIKCHQITGLLGLHAVKEPVLIMQAETV